MFRRSPSGVLRGGIPTIEILQDGGRDWSQIGEVFAKNPRYQGIATQSGEKMSLNVVTQSPNAVNRVQAVVGRLRRPPNGTLDPRRWVVRAPAA